MIYIIFAVLAVIFAIPTWGLSLVAFWLFNKFLNKAQAKPIMVAMYSSYKLGEEITLPRTSHSAVRTAFKLLNVTDYEEQYFSGMRLRTFTGYVHHPMHPSRLLVQVHSQHMPDGKSFMVVGSSDTSAEAKEWLNELLVKKS